MHRKVKWKSIFQTFHFAIVWNGKIIPFTKVYQLNVSLHSLANVRDNMNSAMLRNESFFSGYLCFKEFVYPWNWSIDGLWAYFNCDARDEEKSDGWNKCLIEPQKWNEFWTAPIVATCCHKWAWRLFLLWRQFAINGAKSYMETRERIVLCTWNSQKGVVCYKFAAVTHLYTLFARNSDPRTLDGRYNTSPWYRR